MAVIFRGTRRNTRVVRPEAGSPLKGLKGSKGVGILTIDSLIIAQGCLRRWEYGHGNVRILTVGKGKEKGKDRGGWKEDSAGMEDVQSVLNS